MKYCPKYSSKGFSSLDEAREWVQRFVKWYNFIQLHSGINFITPYQRHYGLDKRIMENRIKVYEEAKRQHPECWSRNTRDWSLPEYVALNPTKEGEIAHCGFISI